MTDVHTKYPCESCGRKFRHLHGMDENLCFNCATKTRIPTRSQIFIEPLNQNVHIYTTLTKSQHNTLKKRLLFLFPFSKSKGVLPFVSRYVRELILDDLQRWEERG